MKVSVINASAGAADVVLIAANNDISSTFGRGADRGPAAIRLCLDEQIELLEPRSGINATSRLKIGWLDLGDLNGDRSVEALARAVETVRKNCSAVRRALRFPFVIGGDHSNAIGALIAAGETYSPSDVTVLHIDAHHDLRFDDGDCGDAHFGRFSHGCALRHAADAGFRIVQVGVRAFSEEELAYARSNSHVKTFYWGRPRGFTPPHLDEIVMCITTPHVYVTLDVDGIDPAFMPATGTPVSGGLDWWYAWDLLEKICRERAIIGADICEVAPRSGESLTEYNAAQLVYGIITWSQCAKRIA
jgi:agmatinase